MERDTADLDVSPLFRDVLDKTAEVTASGDFGENIDVRMSDEVNKAMYDGFQALRLGDKSPEEVAADLQAAAAGA